MIIVSAPSGTGKTEVIKQTIKSKENRKSIIRIGVSWTTRSPRPEEIDGVHYHFKSREEFIKKRDAGGFLEWEENFGNLYGTPIEEENDRELVILDIDSRGAEKIKQRRPRVRRVFLLPPSYQELERRLRGRKGDSEESITLRLAKAVEEIRVVENYDCWIVNRDIEESARKLFGVLLSFHFNATSLPRSYRNMAELERIRSTFPVHA